MVDVSALIGLFAAALLAATAFPFQSEALLAGLIVLESYPVWLLVGIATAGNVLGSCTNWVLGRYLLHYGSRRWFPLKPDQLARAQSWYRRYGRWSLLLSWVPVIGDPLTLVAGVLREPLKIFVPLVTIAKLGRYIAVAAVAEAWLAA